MKGKHRRDCADIDIRKYHVPYPCIDSSFNRRLRRFKFGKIEMGMSIYYHDCLLSDRSAISTK